jgi:hypothetical protein
MVPGPADALWDRLKRSAWLNRTGIGRLNE